jgi:hypothetical protein
MLNAVRRFGTNPRGRTPARSAMPSAHAPAALISVGAQNVPAGVVTNQRSSLRSIDCTSAFNIILPQDRHPGDRSRNIYLGDGRHQGPRTLELLLQQLKLIRPCDGDHAARRQQRMIAKVGGRTLEECTACDGETPHHVAAVVLGKAGRRPSG